MKKYAMWILSLTVMMIVPFLAQAQVVPDPALCPTCPVDGGLSLLLAAGVGYGVKKVRESRKKNQVVENI